ncbi:MAG TPA: methionyl-tRNA formyltransferase [Spirochaetota bacterium]|mgnify:CR=1 FL=1|nr:methionyl-tRNA formyltransferase [Spirochaetota bacterium]HOM37755.1 methionyl-tRNA formyltransferase [Spirochaetota bacterium]HPQ49368.1 methionyl-tRNA formyltransferase [Spirochaetota bacterium]
MFSSIFFGNSDFCLPSLNVLYQKTNLKLILTGEDKPIGRGMKSLKVPEPKKFALAHNIDFIQGYEFDDNVLDRINSIKPDIMIVISYGKIIPKNVYEIPRIGTFNIHASILPKYRGASPIHEALINGDKKTGVTIQRINDKIDNGNIVYLKEIDILSEDNYLTLRDKLAALSADALSEFLDIAENGSIIEKTQEGPVSYCRKIKKEDALIYWDRDTTDIILNKYRAFILWPNIYTFYKGKKIILTEIGRYNKKLSLDIPGSISIENKKMIVKTIDGAISIEKIKPENSREMSSGEFINGYKIKNGEVLG